MPPSPSCPHQAARRTLDQDLTAWVRAGHPMAAWWTRQRGRLCTLATAAGLERPDVDALDPETMLDLLAGLEARAANGSLQQLRDGRRRTPAPA